MSENTTLDQLKKGERAKITLVEDDAADMGTRLRELGFAEDMRVELLQVGTLGDPLVVQVGSMRVALRENDARLIGIERI